MSGLLIESTNVTFKSQELPDSFSGYLPETNRLPNKSCHVITSEISAISCRDTSARACTDCSANVPGSPASLLRKRQSQTIATSKYYAGCVYAFRRVPPVFCQHRKFAIGENASSPVRLFSTFESGAGAVHFQAVDTLSQVLCRDNPKRKLSFALQQAAGIESTGTTRIGFPLEVGGVWSLLQRPQFVSFFAGSSRRRSRNYTRSKHAGSSIAEVRRVTCGCVSEMPGISQSRFHSTIRRPAADALDGLARRTEDILAAWHYVVRPLGLDPNDFLPAASFDFSLFAKELRCSTYEVLRQRVGEFGKGLAKHASLDQAVVAFNELFEICIRVLLEDESRRATPIIALSRLYALVGLVVVSGYTGEWGSGRETLVEASVLEAEDEVHSASAYIMRIYEQQLHRLAGELHDELGRDLVRIQLYLETIARAAQGKGTAEFQPPLTEALALVAGSIDSVRRLGVDLGRAVFDDLGFLPAVRIYTRQFSARNAINVVLREGYIPSAVPMTHQVTLYRLIQDALANTLGGGSARNVIVSLGSINDSALVMVIEDDGIGPNTKHRLARRPFGVTVMRERVESLGGRIRVESRRAPRSTHSGTRIEVNLPLPGAGMQ